MASFKRFEDIGAWKKARELTRLIYEVTSSGDWARDFGLRDQVRRAAVSVMSNIAEGFERQTPAEFARFLTMAKGSAGEVRSQLYVAFDMEYVDQKTFLGAFRLAEATSKMLAGLIGYVRAPKKTPVADRAEYPVG